MRRAPGWIRLAGIALELGALAFLGYVLMERRGSPRYLGGPSTQPRAEESKHHDDIDEKPPRYLGGPSIPQDDMAGSHRCHAEVSKYGRGIEAPDAAPIDFIKESADQHARYYRASDETAELIAGFYSDGRVRLADAQHRFAGMLQSGHADLLELENNQWSELYVHTTPTGRMQLELRGGPYDARVLTCDPFDKLRMTVD